MTTINECGVISGFIPNYPVSVDALGHIDVDCTDCHDCNPSECDCVDDDDTDCIDIS